MRINIELLPVYSISANLSNAAAECNIGNEFFANTLAIMIDSRKVQVRDSHNGNNIPLKKAAGLNNALRSAFRIAQKFK